MLEALRGGAADDGGDGPPLVRHELGHVEKLLLLFAFPLGLLDGGVQPLIPDMMTRNDMKYMTRNQKRRACLCVVVSYICAIKHVLHAIEVANASTAITLAFSSYVGFELHSSRVA